MKSKGVFFALLLLSIPSVTLANVLEIEIPTWITDSMLINGNPTAYDTLRSIIKRKVASLPENAGYDIVVFTRDGKMVNLYTDTIIDTNIVPSFLVMIPCRGLGWSNEQWDSITSKWNTFYNVIMSIYGPPFHPQLVRISNRDSVSCPLIPGNKSGLYCPPFAYPICRILCDPLPISYCDIVPLPKGIIYTQNVNSTLSHEMVHAFRGLWVITLYPHYEEGHADAVEIEVANRIGYPHSWIFHGGKYYPFHQFFNQNFISAPTALTFQFSKAVDSDFRYITAGYLWWKVYKENPYFFYVFNSLLKTFNPLIPRTWSELLGISSLSVGVGTVEGRTFPSWFILQPMFQILPTPGRYLEVVPTFEVRSSSGNVYLYIFNFSRDFIGEEINSDGRIRVRIWNSTGDLVKDTMDNFRSLRGEDGRKYIQTSLEPSCADTIKTPNGVKVLKYERFKVELSLVNAEGNSDCRLYDEKYIGFIQWGDASRDIPINLAGAVSSELEVDVNINDITIRSKCGVFYLTGMASGTYNISYNSRFAAPRSITLTKDKGFYHVYPISYGNFDISIPPIRPKGLKVDSVFMENRDPFIVIHIYLSWKPNKDCDTRGYKIYRAIDWGDGPLVFYALDSTGGVTYHDEVLVASITSEYPNIYYFITAYDRDHVYAQNESMPSDTISVFRSLMALSANNHRNESEYEGADRRELKLFNEGRKVILMGKGKVEIYEPTGRLIMMLSINGYEEISLKPGVYMFRVNGKVRKEIVR